MTEQEIRVVCCRECGTARPAVFDLRAQLDRLREERDEAVLGRDMAIADGAIGTKEQRAESWRKGMDRYLAVIAERNQLHQLLAAALDIADRETDREGQGPIGSWGRRKAEVAALRAQLGALCPHRK